MSSDFALPITISPIFFCCSGLRLPIAPVRTSEFPVQSGAVIEFVWCSESSFSSLCSSRRDSLHRPFRLRLRVFPSRFSNSETVRKSGFSPIFAICTINITPKISESPCWGRECWQIPKWIAISKTGTAKMSAPILPTNSASFQKHLAKGKFSYLLWRLLRSPTDFCKKGGDCLNTI